MSRRSSRRRSERGIEPVRDALEVVSRMVVYAGIARSLPHRWEGTRDGLASVERHLKRIARMEEYRQALSGMPLRLEPPAEEET